ncbi:hypothetical protein [Oceanisphaera pacifica]|uniref:hypothetical protein n=1 Tax=Oceanisphaera pacifica TaxID=2818389 RepID=UPI001FB08EDD|nr:hypothetical protein [Oceanisphaera pacifica]
MKKLLSSVLISAALLGTSTYALASEIEITPQATYALTQQQGNDMLFIDVRDPVEIMFIGFTDQVDQNIPYLMVNRNNWRDDQQRFEMQPKLCKRS